MTAKQKVLARFDDAFLSLRNDEPFSVRAGRGLILLGQGNTPNEAWEDALRRLKER